MLNLFMLCQMLPPLWSLVPILPILKPCARTCKMAGHRPISFMAAALKLLDKILFRRVRRPIASAVAPWQLGGVVGADEACWILSQILTAYSHQQRSNIFLAFLDGESAFCRPPAACMLCPPWGLAGISALTWLAIHGIISGLHGTAWLRGKFYGFWKTACGGAQGGSLSSALFGLALL